VQAAFREAPGPLSFARISVRALPKSAAAVAATTAKPPDDSIHRRSPPQKKFFRALLRQAHQTPSEFHLEQSSAAAQPGAWCILLLANEAMCIIMHLAFQEKKNMGGVL
jgi:hypothetical protein